MKTPSDRTLLFCRNLRRLRRQAGLSARQLAEQANERGLDWDRSIVANIEYGRRLSATIDELCVAAEIFNVHPMSLIGTAPCETCYGMPPNGFTCDACGAPA